jgi:hypothetical protein
VKHSRVLTGYEKMRMQGFPDDFIRDYPVVPRPPSKGGDSATYM